MPTLDLTPVDESNDARGLRAPRLAIVAHPHLALGLSSQVFGEAAEYDAALEFVYEGDPWRRLRIHKLAHLGVGYELNTPEVYVPLHVVNLGVTTTAEADAAQALSVTTGDITFVSIVPANVSG